MMRMTFVRSLVLLAAALALAACSGSGSDGPTGPDETFAEVILGGSQTGAVPVEYTRTEVARPEHRDLPVSFLVTEFENAGPIADTKTETMQKAGPRKYTLGEGIAVMASTECTTYSVAVIDSARQKEGTVATEIRIGGVLLTDIRDFSGSKEVLVDICVDGRVIP